MADALTDFLGILEKNGKPHHKVEIDKEGRTFVIVDVATARQYLNDVIGLAQYRCVDYVSVRKRGVNELVRIYAPPRSQL